MNIEMRKSNAPSWKDIHQQLVLVASTVFLFSLIVNIFTLAIPLYSLQIFDRVSLSQSKETLLMLFVAVFICFSAMLGFEVLRRRILAITAITLSKRLTNFSLNQQGLYALKNTNQRSDNGESTFDTGALDRTIQNLRSPAIIALIDALLTPLFLTLLFVLHPAFAIAATTINLALLGICRLQFLTIEDRSSTTTKRTKSSIRWLMSDYQYHWAQGDENRLINRIRPIIENDHLVQSNQFESQSKLSMVILTIRYSGQIAIPTIGALLLIQQQISPGVLLAAMILGMKSLFPWEQVFHHCQTLNELCIDLKKLKDSSEFDSSHQHTPITALSGSIFLALCLKGQPQKISITPGSLTAIVGPNASGKSSLLQALAGLPFDTSFDVEVRYDEYPIGNIDRSYFSGSICFLTCANAIPNLSVRDLICESKDRNTEALYKVCKSIGLHQRLLKLSYGYETIINEDPVTRSPGILNLILLARALLTNPKFIFIDNLDACFDKNGLECFKDTLIQLTKAGITTIFTTQRKSLLKDCDNVLLCDRDKVLHFGQKIGPLSETPSSDITTTMEIPK